MKGEASTMKGWGRNTTWSLFSINYCQLPPLAGYFSKMVGPCGITIAFMARLFTIGLKLNKYLKNDVQHQQLPTKIPKKWKYRAETGSLFGYTHSNSPATGCSEEQEFVRSFQSTFYRDNGICKAQAAYDLLWRKKGAEKRHTMEVLIG